MTTDAAAASQDPGGATSSSQGAQQPTTPPNDPPAGQQPGQPGTTSDDGKNNGADSAPAEYADFTFPQGYEVNPERLGEFHTFAKDMGLSQEKAQKLIDYDAKRQVEAAKQTAEAWSQTTAAWKEQTLSDPVLTKGDVDANLATSEKGFQMVAQQVPGLRELFGEFDAEKNPKGMGLGNHPDVVKAFFIIGKSISEDALRVGGDGATGAKTPEQKINNMYPTMAQNQ